MTALRLTELEKTALHQALQNLAGRAYLFGSRTELHKKGGDIDLLIFSKEDSYLLSQKIHREFFKLCEEKLDVVIMDPDHLTETQHAFLNTITKVELSL